MDVSEVAVSTFDHDHPLAGVAGHTEYIVYDNTCTPRGPGAYSPLGNDCGIPYLSKKIGFPMCSQLSNQHRCRQGLLQFYYANSLDSINNNGCSCQDMSSGLEAEKRLQMFLHNSR